MHLLHPSALFAYALAAALIAIAYFVMLRGTPRSQTVGLILLGLAIAVVAFRIVFLLAFILLLFILSGSTGG